ncbi:MAG: hypothetical protein AAF191_05665 [Verrucomicrobiota bacterium]
MSETLEKRKWFLQFHHSIPDDAQPEEYARYNLGERIPIPIGTSDPPESCPHRELQKAILAFERTHRVNDWREIAYGYRVFLTEK